MRLTPVVPPLPQKPSIVFGGARPIVGALLFEQPLHKKPPKNNFAIKLGDMENEKSPSPTETLSVTDPAAAAALTNPKDLAAARALS